VDVVAVIACTVITWLWWADTPEPDAFILEVYTESEEYVGSIPYAPDRRQTEINFAYPMCFAMLTIEGDVESPPTDMVCSTEGICH